eukprot:GEMP01000222.1.p1 GENE.GEMP01000222.1~~GEMP01000222.1.p1  ORF type:complete len:2226 (+),score=406.42 GEMP01000222.1:1588-8265(+)
MHMGMAAFGNMHTEKAVGTPKRWREEVHLGDFDPDNKVEHNFNTLKDFQFDATKVTELILPIVEQVASAHATCDATLARFRDPEKHLDMKIDTTVGRYFEFKTSTGVDANRTYGLPPLADATRAHCERPSDLLTGKSFQNAFCARKDISEVMEDKVGPDGAKYRIFLNHGEDESALRYYKNLGMRALNTSYYVWSDLCPATDVTASDPRRIDEGKSAKIEITIDRPGPFLLNTPAIRFASPREERSNPVLHYEISLVYAAKAIPTSYALRIPARKWSVSKNDYKWTITKHVAASPLTFTILFPYNREDIILEYAHIYSDVKQFFLPSNNPEQEIATTGWPLRTIVFKTKGNKTNIVVDRSNYVANVNHATKKWTLLSLRLRPVQERLHLHRGLKYHVPMEDVTATMTERTYTTVFALRAMRICEEYREAPTSGSSPGSFGYSRALSAPIAVYLDPKSSKASFWFNPAPAAEYPSWTIFCPLYKDNAAGETSGAQPLLPVRCSADIFPPLSVVHVASLAHMLNVTYSLSHMPPHLRIPRSLARKFGPRSVIVILFPLTEDDEHANALEGPTLTRVRCATCVLKDVRELWKKVWLRSETVYFLATNFLLVSDDGGAQVHHTRAGDDVPFLQLSAQKNAKERTFLTYTEGCYIYSEDDARSANSMAVFHTHGVTAPDQEQKGIAFVAPTMPPLDGENRWAVAFPQFDEEAHLTLGDRQGNLYDAQCGGALYLKKSDTIDPFDATYAAFVAKYVDEDTPVWFKQVSVVLYAKQYFPVPDPEAVFVTTIFDLGCAIFVNPSTRDDGPENAYCAFACTMATCAASSAKNYAKVFATAHSMKKGDYTYILESSDAYIYRVSHVEVANANGREDPIFQTTHTAFLIKNTVTEQLMYRGCTLKISNGHSIRVLSSDPNTQKGSTASDDPVGLFEVRDATTRLTHGTPLKVLRTDCTLTDHHGVRVLPSSSLHVFDEVDIASLEIEATVVANPQEQSDMIFAINVPYVRGLEGMLIRAICADDRATVTNNKLLGISIQHNGHGTHELESLRLQVPAYIVSLVAMKGHGSLRPISTDFERSDKVYMWTQKAGESESEMMVTLSAEEPDPAHSAVGNYSAPQSTDYPDSPQATVTGETIWEPCEDGFVRVSLTVCVPSTMDTLVKDPPIVDSTTILRHVPGDGTKIHVRGVLDVKTVASLLSAIESTVRQGYAKTNVDQTKLTISWGNAISIMIVCLTTHCEDATLRTMFDPSLQAQPSFILRRYEAEGGSATYYSVFPNPIDPALNERGLLHPARLELATGDCGGNQSDPTRPATAEITVEDPVAWRNTDTCSQITSPRLPRPVWSKYPASELADTTVDYLITNINTIDIRVRDIAHLFMQLSNARALLNELGPRAALAQTNLFTDDRSVPYYHDTGSAAFAVPRSTTTTPASTTSPHGWMSALLRALSDIPHRHLRPLMEYAFSDSDASVLKAERGRLDGMDVFNYLWQGFDSGRHFYGQDADARQMKAFTFDAAQLYNQLSTANRVYFLRDVLEENRAGQTVERVNITQKFPLSLTTCYAPLNAEVTAKRYMANSPRFNGWQVMHVFTIEYTEIFGLESGNFVNMDSKGAEQDVRINRMCWQTKIPLLLENLGGHGPAASRFMMTLIYNGRDVDPEEQVALIPTEKTEWKWTGRLAPDEKNNIKFQTRKSYNGIVGIKVCPHWLRYKEERSENNVEEPGLIHATDDGKKGKTYARGCWYGEDITVREFQQRGVLDLSYLTPEGAGWAIGRNRWRGGHLATLDTLKGKSLWSFRFLSGDFVSGVNPEDDATSSAEFEKYESLVYVEIPAEPIPERCQSGFPESCVKCHQLETCGKYDVSRAVGFGSCPETPAIPLTRPQCTKSSTELNFSFKGDGIIHLLRNHAPRDDCEYKSGCYWVVDAPHVYITYFDSTTARTKADDTRSGDVVFVGTIGQDVQQAGSSCSQVLPKNEDIVSVRITKALTKSFAKNQYCLSHELRDKELIATFQVCDENNYGQKFQMKRIEPGGPHFRIEAIDSDIGCLTATTASSLDPWRRLRWEICEYDDANRKAWSQQTFYYTSGVLAQVVPGNEKAPYYAVQSYYGLGNLQSDIQKNWELVLNDKDDAPRYEMCTQNCAGQVFHCNNTMCIPENWKCDGVNNCRDSFFGSDEEDCPSHTRSADTHAEQSWSPLGVTMLALGCVLVLGAGAIYIYKARTAWIDKEEDKKKQLPRHLPYE